jgi:hypothetical protein
MIHPLEWALIIMVSVFLFRKEISKQLNKNK